MAGILLEGANVTDEERAAHARKVAAAGRAAGEARAARAIAERAAALEAAGRVDGRVLADEVVAAGASWSAKLAAGERLRIVDLEGRQAVDFMCYDAADTANRYNAGNTLKFNRSIFLGQGTRLYSDRADVLMQVTADTVGYHDTIGGCCSAESNHLRYGIADTPSCRANFLGELAKHGMDARDLPANVNFFMYVPVTADGATEILEGKSEPGDYVDVEAVRDCLVVISNCPQAFNPCNGWVPSPIRLIHWLPQG
jgi:urea carboxylase-associated protein 1